MSEELEQEAPVVEETQAQENKPMSFEDGVIKVNLSELNKPEQNAIPEQEANASDVPVGESEDEGSSEEMVQEVREPSEENVPNEIVNSEDVPSALEEITDEQVQEQAEELTNEVQDAIAESNETGVELPENIQKVVEFINDTGGSLEDYVKLNTDYSSLNEAQLLENIMKLQNLI